MTLSKKSHKPTEVHRAHAKTVNHEPDAARELLLSMVEKPQLERLPATESVAVNSTPKIPEPVATLPKDVPVVPLGDSFDSRK